MALGASTSNIGYLNLWVSFLDILARRRRNCGACPAYYPTGSICFLFQGSGSKAHIPGMIFGVRVFKKRADGPSVFFARLNGPARLAGVARVQHARHHCYRFFGFSDNGTSDTESKGPIATLRSID